MPEQRLQRTRATLPSEYQFGDAAVGAKQLRELMAGKREREANALGVSQWELARRARDAQRSREIDAADDAEWGDE